MRAYNFNPGTTIIPPRMLEKLHSVFTEYGNSGLGALELHAGSKAAQELLEATRATLRRVLCIPEDYGILFLAGDLSMQFAQIPMNLMRNSRADYLLTGKRAQLAKDQADRFGNARVVITGEDMWHIPVLGELLKSLGKAWHTTALGTITRFDMDFSLDKTTFRIDNGSSNGSVVAIRTDGEYNWQNEEFDFRILSELLKGTLPFAAMSKVLSPVSWILQKRIRGKGDVFTLEE